MIGIGFLFILGYSALWFTVAFDYERQAGEKLAELEDLGMHIAYDDVTLAGFPYRIVIEVNDLVLSDRNN